MKKTSYALAATAAMIALALGSKGFAASTTGTAKQVVIQAIAITNVSDLDFGSAPPADAAKTVAAGTTDGPANGSFNVTGEPNKSYTITLPADGAVTMTTGAGGTNQTIAVGTFTSFPSANGTLSNSGSQTLLVGATRAALSASQTPGTYTGTYTVTVVY